MSEEELDPAWFDEPGPEQTGYLGRCNAIKQYARRNGLTDRCKLPAGWRTGHLGVGPCRFHSGNAPGVVRKYDRIAASALMHGYGLLREGFVDPRDALMEELQRTLGNIDYLTVVLADLTEDELLGVVPLPAELRQGESDKDGAKRELLERFGLPVVVDLYRWERTHLAKLSADAVKLGLLERAVRIEEAQAALVGTALTRTLERLGLGPDQLAEARTALREELTRVEREQAARGAVNQHEARRILESGAD